MTRKRVLTRVFFLGVTALAIGTECWFAWDGDPETDPWTDLIGDYVPWQLAVAVFGALLLWVPVHFWVRYKREAVEQATKKLFAIDQAVDRGNALARIQDDMLRDKELPFYYGSDGRRIWKDSKSGQAGPEQDTLF